MLFIQMDLENTSMAFHKYKLDAHDHAFEKMYLSMP